MERHAAARRIVSLSAAATEILYAAGAGDSIVATVKGTEFPAEALSLPQVGTAAAPDTAAIEKLRADLLVVSLDDSGPAVVAGLRARGWPVFALRLRQPDDVATAVEQLGWLARSEAVAGLAAHNLREDIKRLRQQSAAPLPVMIVVDVQGQTVAGPAHFLHGAVALCGGSNVFADTNGVSSRVSAAQLRDAAAQWIVVDAKSGSGWRHQLPWRELTAVREGRVHVLRSNSPAITGPRLIRDLERLCQGLGGNSP